MIPSNLTYKEILRSSSSISFDELLNVFEKVVDELDDLKEVSKREEKYYESAMEQSYFRRAVIAMKIVMWSYKNEY